MSAFGRPEVDRDSTKVLAPTLGETGGDTVSMTLNG